MSPGTHLTLLSQVTIDCLQVYGSVHSVQPLSAAAAAILEKVEQALMTRVGLAYLSGSEDIESLPEDVRTTSAEQVAAAYRDIHLRFEDLKAAVYDLGKALLDDEHTCEQGAALIDALARHCAGLPGCHDAPAIRTLPGLGVRSPC